MAINGKIEQIIKGVLYQIKIIAIKAGCKILFTILFIVKYNDDSTPKAFSY